MGTGRVVWSPSLRRSTAFAGDVFRDLRRVRSQVHPDDRDHVRASVGRPSSAASITRSTGSSRRRRVRSVEDGGWSSTAPLAARASRGRLRGRDGGQARDARVAFLARSRAPSPPRWTSTRLATDRGGHAGLCGSDSAAIFLRDPESGAMMPSHGSALVARVRDLRIRPATDSRYGHGHRGRCARTTTARSARAPSSA